MVITNKELNRSGEHMYIKVAENRGYAESTYQGSSIIMSYYLSGSEAKLRIMNLIQENHINTWMDG